MQKKFLVTISNDFDHLTGVEFLCSFFKKESEHHLTLLHICRLDAADMNKALLEMWDNPDEKIQGRLTVGARKAIDKAQQMISQSRMSVDQMITKTVAERYGKVQDIMAEGHEGLYDAVILGKRAAYALQWIFERPADEIAQSIIRDNSFNMPLWVCPEIEAGRKNVLVCIDGSENSYRAVDHVGYILRRQNQHRITLFQVNNGTVPDSVAAFGKAEKILLEHSIQQDRIDRSDTWGLSVVNTILNKALKGGYAAVAVGLHGQQQGMLKDFNLAGGTTSALISKAEKLSVWCCP